MTNFTNKENKKANIGLHSIQKLLFFHTFSIALLLVSEGPIISSELFTQ